MGPRALLLSADDKVCTPLQEALAAGDCQVQRCKDIFSAVEAITQHAFQILLIDWQEALEASFLLQTARDLKSNQAAFVVALVNSAQAREALEMNADAILAKPFSVEQAKEMLLPKLGAKPDGRDTESRPAPADTVPAQVASLPAPAPFPLTADNVLQEQPRATARRRIPTVPLERPHARPSRSSRMLSIAAVVWPLIIAAALIAFDQWPNLSRNNLARLSTWLQAADAKAAQFPQLRAPAQQAHGGVTAIPERPNISMTDDLLSDYSSPTESSGALPESNAKPGDIDLASVEALPSSTRSVVPAFTIEPSRPALEVPSSLRFPPPAVQSAVAVMPEGHLTSPDWVENPIELPEAVTRSLLDRQVAPQYPEQALRAGMDGPVVLQASIDKDGAVRELRLISGYLVLAHAAVDAVRQWHYKPYRRNGKNVEVETLITVNFKRPPRG